MKKILFVTGTRADFGKLKVLIQAVHDHEDFEYTIFVTGMHMLRKYGLTVTEITKCGFKNIYKFINQIHGDPMEQVLANTITGLSRYLHEYDPDLIVTHGDRVEALATAITGTLQNLLVAHVEGGELSGTVDESLRHSISKLAHIHFVANIEAASRLRQMGESPDSITVIGSPNIDIMLSPDLAKLEEVEDYYEIDFDSYAIMIFHPVTTELDTLYDQAGELVDAVLESNLNYIVIYPNNDEGNADIFRQIDRLKNNPRFEIYPSLRFEYFLTFLKNAAFIVGNSSAGVREAPVYSVPTINIGTRQQNRSFSESIVNVDSNKAAILDAIAGIDQSKRSEPSLHFGDGNSDALFIKALTSDALWNITTQKLFHHQDSAT